MRKKLLAFCSFLVLVSGLPGISEAQGSNGDYPPGHPGRYIKSTNPQESGLPEAAKKNASDYGTQITFSGISKWETDWSSDDQWISYNEDGDIWIVSPNGSNPLNLTPYLSGYCYLPFFTPDNSAVAFTREDNTTGSCTIESVNLNGRNLQVIVTDALAGCWSWNGRYLAYRDYSTSELVLYDSQTGSTTVIAEGDFMYGSSCFSADDEYVITGMEAEDGTMKLFSIPLDGGEPIQLTYGSGSHNYPDISPDGTWVLYTDTNDFTLHAVSRETGQTKPVFPETAQWNFMGRFSPEGDRLCYLLDVDGINEVFVADFTIIYTPVTFPDPNLEAVIREALNKYEGQITDYDLAKLTELNAEERDISDLAGIEYCVNLQSLYMYSNQISDLSPLSNLTNLQAMELQNNQISDLSPLSSLTNLANLFLHFNQISDLSPLSSLNKIMTLWLDGNPISDLSPLSSMTNLQMLLLEWTKNISNITPLSELKNLNHLKLSDNQIDDIEPLRELTKLGTLYIYSNKISNIEPISGLTNLNDLWLDGNQISDLSPLSSLINLAHLRLGGNQISDINPLSSLTNLQDLRLGGNQISDLSPLSNLTNLQGLYLHENQISDISPLSSLTNLQSLYLHFNQISDINPLSSLTNLVQLCLNSNRISDLRPLRNLTNLEGLSMEDNQIIDLSPLSSLIKLQELDLDQNQISDISSLINLTDLRVLWIDDNQIQDIYPLAGLEMIGEWEGWVEVQDGVNIHLGLSNNRINDLSPLLDNPGIGEGDGIDLRGNPLTNEAFNNQIPALRYRGINVLFDMIAGEIIFPDLNLEAAIRDALNKYEGPITEVDLAELTDLNAWDRDISDLNGIEHCVNLQWLGLGGNRISDISTLAGLTQLTGLFLEYNRISDISPLSGMTQLTELRLSGHQISDLTPIAGMTELIDLRLDRNQISDLSLLAGMNQLTHLELESNRISDLSPLSGLSSLENLVLHDNQISDLSPLSNLANLQRLNLDNNQISDISPLSNLTNLNWLILAANQISDLSPLSNLANLQRLNLDNNQISDISPLSNLTNLNWLILAANQISDLSPLSNLANLQRLNLDNNQISDLSPLSNLTNLNWLILADNQISDLSPLSNLTNMQSLTVDCNQISDLSPLSNLTNMQSLTVDCNQISDLSPLSNLTNLQLLNLGGNQIGDLSPLINLTDLRFFYLDNNIIQDISPLAGMKMIGEREGWEVWVWERDGVRIHLGLSNNRISDVNPLLDNPGIGEGDGIDLRGNPLTDEANETHIPALQARGAHVLFDPPGAVTIPDPNLEAAIREALNKPEGPITDDDLAVLTDLNASEQGISNLACIEYCVNLQGLSFDGNQISDISPLSNLTNLQGLSIINNQISDLSPLSGMTNLELLEMGNNQISDLSPLSSLTNLQALYMYGNNQISDLSPLSNLINLEELVMDGNNQISDFSPLSNMAYLEYLSLNGTQISDLSPLSNLTNLRNLYLDNSQIQNISPLVNLTKIGEEKEEERWGTYERDGVNIHLGLSNNLISDISPLVSNTGIGEGDGIDLRGNPLSIEAYNNQIPALQARGVDVLFDLPGAVTFSDTNFEAAIREALGKPEGPITEEDLSKLTELYASEKGIRNLTGIEHCVNLQNLNLNSNQISDLGPLSSLTNLESLAGLNHNQISDLSPLSGLTKLESLSLSDNQISDLGPLSNLTNLNWMHLDANQISDISPLSSLTRIQKLYLGQNQIEDLSPLSSLTSLVELGLGNNRISDISPLSNLSNLQWLSLYGHQISDLSPLSSLTNMLDLCMDKNQISDISPLSDLTNLDWLSLQQNQIEDISPLSGLSNLRTLSMGANQISDLSPLSDLTNLLDLDMSENQISDISQLSNLTDLWFLHLDNNQIQNVSPLAGLTKIGEEPEWVQSIDIDEREGVRIHLGLSDNRISDISSLVSNTGIGEGDGIDLRLNPLSKEAHETHIPDLQARGASLLFDPPGAVTIPDPNLEAAIREALNKPEGPLTEEDLAGLTEELDASKRDISDLTGIGHCVNLQRLILQSNQISDISPLSNLTNLYWLWLDGNQIIDLSPLSGTNNLVDLNLNGNQIIDLSPLSNMTNLQSLHLFSNQIGDISSLSNMTNLIMIRLHNNQISDLSPLSSLTSLVSLELNGNQISDLSPLSSLTNLQLLYLHINQISDLSPLSGLTNMQQLIVDVNQISDISPLSSLTNLECLSIVGNQISDINPLVNLTNLGILYLDDNQIQNVSPLVSLTKIGEEGEGERWGTDEREGVNIHLGLSNNQISDISPLASNTGIGENDGIDLRGNPLSNEAHETQIPDLRNRKVNVLFDPRHGEIFFADLNLEAAIREVLNKPEGPITEEELAELTDLDAMNRDISNLTGIEHCVNLQGLEIDGNHISDISPLSGLTSLVNLYLHENQISDLSPLSSLTNLHGLYMGSNQISDLSPLINLTNLRVLYLDGNQIQDISYLAGLEMIGEGEYWLDEREGFEIHLALSNNRISDVSPLVSNTGIGEGDGIDLRGNPLSTSTLPKIQELQNRGVTILYGVVSGEPDISLSVLTHDFENVRVDTSSDWTLTVSNVGTADLFVSNISSDKPDFKVDSTSFTVPSGNSHAVTITFNPTKTGPQSAAITVTSNDSDENTVAVSVSGTGITPEITVTSPNGGEVWEVGSVQNVTWDSQGVAQVRIEYSTDGGGNWNLIVDRTDSAPGSYQWDIPDIESSSCLVRITDTSDDTITDENDSIFTISRMPFIQVTAPMEGDLWMEESAQTIEWKSSSVSEINIEYSTDGGGSWTTIQTNVNAFDPNFYWTVPEDESDTCIIRISDVSNPEIRDESGIFKITTSDYITITSPAADDKWSVNTEKEIKWEVKGVANVSIEVSYDDGNTWAEMLAGSVDASTGSYSWIVPDTPNDRCRIRFADTSRPDKVFFITEPFEIIRPEVKIAHMPKTAAQENEKIIFTVTVTSTTEVESVIFCYNKMGESESMVTYPMELTVDNTYSYTLPVGVFIAPGIEYHIIATDVNGIEARSPVDVGFHSINARISDVKSKNEVYGGSEQTAYRMISIPFYLNATSIVDQLMDTLPPGKMGANWRLFRYPAGSTTPQEYPDIEPFLPGRAFWLISVDNFILKTPEGKTVPTDERFRIDLKSGWNDIANPWMFDISWDNMENPGNARLSALYTYEGQWSDPTNPPKILKPWKGYAIKNLESSTKLIFLRTESMVEKPAVAQDTEIWKLTIRASAGEAKDTANHLGVRSDAKVEWDRYDHVEPPPIGEYVSVSFPHHDWEQYPYDYTVDFRPPDSTILWDFDVKTNISRETVTINFEGMENLPEEHYVKVFDRDTKHAVDVNNNTFRFISEKTITERHFMLVVSDTDKPELEEYESRPERFVTAMCFPNPFNPQTTIRYELSMSGKVVISIYNTLGQQVKHYDIGNKDQGVHEIVFDASALTSGIYFYRVDAGYASLTGKMLYIK